MLKDIHIQNFKDSCLESGHISLAPLSDYLHRLLNSQGGRRHLLPWFGLEMIKGVLDSHGEINEDNLESYEGVFEMIHSLQEGLHLGENDIWGLGYPIPVSAFYGTSEFYDFIESDAQMLIQDQKSTPTPILKLIYNIILERLYDIPVSFDKLLFRLKKEDVDVYRYYELAVDFSFVDIQRIGKMQDINLTNWRNKEEYWKNDSGSNFPLFDLKNFNFNGFTILTFKDITINHVSELLHNLIANLSQYKYDQLNVELSQILSSITGSKDILFSFLPVLELNGYPIFTSNSTSNGILFQELQKINTHVDLNPLMVSYLENPYSLYLGIDESKDSVDHFFRNQIEQLGIVSYMGIPLKLRGSLVGLIELYSYVPNKLDKRVISKWKSFVPLLTQLSGEIVYLFKNRLERIILNKYTALNPAVEWRFNEVAAEQLRTYMEYEENIQMDKIRFEKVYPIYGSIDVKGSTQLRNNIYKKDNLAKINHLEVFLSTLKSKNNDSIIESLRMLTGKMRKRLEAKDHESHMLEVFLFLNEELFQVLKSVEVEYPMYKSSIEAFINKQKDIGNSRADAFEISLQNLNSMIKEEVQQFNITVQTIFPSYFELFRSDGIEYDMYIGQSITPAQSFNLIFLREIRKQQIISMVNIGIRASQIAPLLLVPLQVTLLIFANNSPIDISFREDERRFDVEGGYNIRYQMVKKRIDKVRLKGSNERLVRPGTIAIVFQGDIVEDEIRNLLTEVVGMGKVKPNFEFCKLEEVQGVSELRAARADIIIDNT